MKHLAITAAKIVWELVLFAIFLASLMHAQEKSFVWVSTIPRALPDEVKVTEWFDADNAVLYQSHAVELIHATMGKCIVEAQRKGESSAAAAEQESKKKEIGSTCPLGKTPFPGTKDYVVIHVLRWKDATNSNALSVDKQNWYVFHKGKISPKDPEPKDDPAWDDDAYAKNNRIFGRRNIYLLYVHFNRQSNAQYSPRYTMTAKKKTPAYLDHFVSLLQLFGLGTPSGKESKALAPSAWDATPLDTYYVPSDLTFTPTMLPTKNIVRDEAATSTQPPASTPAGTTPSASPQTSSGIPAGVTPAPSPQASANTPAGTTPLPTPQTPAAPAGTVSSTLPPISNTVPPGTTAPTQPTSGAGSNAPSSGSPQPGSIPAEVKLDSQTFDNEGLYHIDFSVAVPIRKIGEISYTSSSNTLVPTKVDKQTTFGVLDYYIKPVDIKNSGWSQYPHALAGVAIDSHPLKRVLIGGGYGPLLAHFYMGLVLDTQSLPPGVACGKIPTSQQLSSGNLRNRTCPSFSLGLNVSAGSILNTLKSKSSTGSGSKAK